MLCTYHDFMALSTGMISSLGSRCFCGRIGAEPRGICIEDSRNHISCHIYGPEANTYISIGWSVGRDPKRLREIPESPLCISRAAGERQHWAIHTIQFVHMPASRCYWPGEVTPNDVARRDPSVA